MDGPGLRVLFATALVVLAGVALGAMIALRSSETEPLVAGVLVALGIGAGLWHLADWRRTR